MKECKKGIPQIILIVGVISSLLALAGCVGGNISKAPLQITTSALPSAQVGTQFRTTVAAAGGVTPYSWAVVSGSLPAGVVVSPTTGDLVGVLTQSGQYSFTVQVSDAAQQFAQKAFRLHVDATLPPLVISTTIVPNGILQVPYSATLTATGGNTPYNWSIISGSLPPGLGLDSSTGTISGVPSQLGGYSFTVQVRAYTAPPETATNTFTITVSNAPLQITTSALSGGAVQAPYSGLLAATGGTAPYSWSIASGSLPGGLSLNGSTGTISGTPTQAGTFPFTAKVTDASSAPQSASQQLAINVAATVVPLSINTPALAGGITGRTYTGTLSVTGGTTPYTWSVSSGSLPPGLNLNASTGAITGTPTTTGTFNFTAQAKDSSLTPQTASASTSILIVAPLQITTASLPTPQLQTSYSVPLGVSGGMPPYLWNTSSGSLPPGLTLNSSTGVISGVPTTAGSYTFTVQVSDPPSLPQTATAQLTVAITAASAKIPISLTLVSSSNPINQGAWLSLTAHLVYAGSLQPTGLIRISEGSTVWNNGLTPVLDETWHTNTISAGSHALVANYSGDANYAASVSPVLVQVINAAAPAPSPLQITTSSLPGGALGVNYSATVAPANGVPPYAWSIVGGQLPPGLVLLASTGQISGNPTQAGTFGFLVQVKDSSGQAASSNFSIVIAPLPAPTIGSVSSNSGPAVGGTSVTITGANFQAGASVLFGGIAASSATVSSATQIQAVTPAHAAGTVNVVVQNPDGQSSTLNGGFVYYNLPPSVSSVSPNTGPAAGGTSVSITGTNFLAGALVFFGGAPASGVVVNSATQIQAITPASIAGVVDVTVQNPDGQSSKLASGFTYTAPLPVGSPTITSVSPNSGTPGTQVTISGTNFAPGAAVAFGGANAASTNFVSSTQLTASVPTIAAGVVDVKVTNSGGSSATLPGGFTVTTPQSLLAGMTPASFALPPGWTLVRTQDFESGLGAGESFSGMSIQSGFSHSGTNAAVGQYTGGDQIVAWYLDAGQINAREIYVSWYEFSESTGRINIDLWVGARWIYSPSQTPVTDVVFNWNPGVNGCFYNCLLGDMVIFAEGTNPPSIPNFSIYDGAHDPMWGKWVQYEMHIKLNDPNVSNGTMELFQNGVLMQGASNLNLIGGLEGAAANLQIGGVYTSQVYYDDAALTACTAPTALGPYYKQYPDWHLPDPCPLQAPPNGFGPIFKRYFDDIIVLKK